MLTLLAVAAAVAPGGPPAHHHVHGCRTFACDHRVHWKRHHPFEFARHHLPAWGVAMLRKLGPGCETIGKSDAVGYALAHDDSGGPHRGRYQFLDGTWARTIPTLPAKLRRWAHGGPANAAIPAEQDVRTFYFIAAGHGGEWACPR